MKSVLNKVVFLTILVTTTFADDYILSLGYSFPSGQPEYDSAYDIDYNKFITTGSELILDAGARTKTSILPVDFEFGPRIKTISGKTLDIGIYSRVASDPILNMRFFIGGVFSWGNDWGEKDSSATVVRNGETFKVKKLGSSTYHDYGIEFGFNIPLPAFDNMEIEFRGNANSRVYYLNLEPESYSEQFNNIFEQLQERYHQTMYTYSQGTITLRYLF